MNQGMAYHLAIPGPARVVRRVTADVVSRLKKMDYEAKISKHAAGYLITDKPVEQGDINAIVEDIRRYDIRLAMNADGC